MQQRPSLIDVEQQLKTWFKDAQNKGFGMVIILQNDDVSPGAHTTTYPFKMLHVPAQTTLKEFCLGKRLTTEPLAILDCSDSVMYPLQNQYPWWQFRLRYLCATVAA